MSTRLRDVLMQELGVLRHEPIEKRIRATLGGETVVDSTRALLVWEPRRVVPTYAVPEEDVRAEIAPAPAGDGADADALGMPAMGAPRLGERVVLDPERAVRRAQHRGRAAGGAGRTAARRRRSAPPILTSTAT